MGRKDFNALRQGARDRNPIVRIAAARALTALSRASILELESDPDPSVQALLTSPEVTAPFWSPSAEVSAAAPFAATAAGDFLGSLGPNDSDPLVVRLAQAIFPDFALHHDSDPTPLVDRLRLLRSGAELKVGSLLMLYLVLFDQALKDRQEWARQFGPGQQPDAGVLASLEPVTEFRALRMSRVIAWAASRAPFERALPEINPRITDSLPKVRLGAYQFVEDLAALTAYEHPPGIDFVEEIAGDSYTRNRAPMVRSRDSNWLESFVQPPTVGRPLATREPHPRYADIRFFDDSDGALGVLLPPTTMLLPNRWYWLEVAIRVSPIGIPDRDLAPVPIRPVRQTDPVRILVVADSRHFDLERSIDWIELPPTGDSLEPLPCFKVKIKQGVSLNGETPEIALRFYYRFNLIEHLVVSAELAPPPQEEPSPTTRLMKRQKSVSREYLDLDEFVPRRLNVHVTRDQDLFRFCFTLSNPTAPDRIVLSAHTELSSVALEGHILKAREVLEALAVRDYVDPEHQSKGRVRETMRRFASVGRALWRALFKSDPSSDLAVVGTALQEIPMADHSLIQISMPGLNTGFLYPWSMLYDRPLPDEDHEIPDSAGFWGYRYAIEQQLGVTTRRPDAPISHGLPLSIAYMLWEGFPNAADQTQFLQELSAQAKGNLTVNHPPLTKAGEFCARLKVKNALDSILYFYTHGIGKRPKTADSVSALAARVGVKLSALPPAAPGRRELEQFVERLQGAEGHEEASIEFSSGRLTYLELAAAGVLFDHGPFVFLNMCESAQLLPLDGENFVALFLRMGARAVLGTECTMSVRFAHPFSQQLLRELLQGTMLAEALRSVRQSFLDARNPLCLAYTLFGSGTLQFQPAPLSSAGPAIARTS